jgi:hypothetical protein
MSKNETVMTRKPKPLLCLESKINTQFIPNFAILYTKKNSFQVKIFLLLCLLLNLKVLLALWIEFGITKLTEVQATTVRPVITYGQFPFFATVPEPLLIPTNTRFV